MHMSSVFPRQKLHHNELQLPLPLPCCPRKTNVRDLSDLIQYVTLFHNESTSIIVLVVKLQYWNIQ